MHKRLYILLSLLLIFGSIRITAQTFPVVSTTQIIPPYSVYLSDYASASSDKLIAHLMLQDQNQSGIQVKLKITVTGDNGVKLQTKPEFLPPPITLYAGSPEQISGTALQDYLEPANLNITGLNYNQFMRDKKLPEGIYQFTVEAVEYRRTKAVSNPGTAVGWLILNDPPVWNLPQQNSTINASNPQNIFFSWFPMHGASPNSAFTVEYEFSLYDLIPQNANPDEYVNIAAPIHQSSTMSNSLVYGPAEIPLEPGRKYAARLRAYDTEGRDMFKNEGYSEVLVFTYGQQCLTPVGISHDGITPHSANISWTAIPGNTEFQLYYREKTSDPNAQWYVGNTAQTTAVITQLKPLHSYQYVLRALCGTLESEPSAIYEFSTTEKISDTLNCDGNTHVPAIDGSPPLDELLVGDVINVGGFEGVITQARGGNGVFSGKCIMRVTNFNILLKSHFDDIHINQSYQVTQGHVIADRGPGIMINLDEIITTLDSLANLPTDSIVDNPDDYLDDLEIIYTIENEQVNDTLIEVLDDIYEDLEILAETGDLTTEQIQSVEDLLDQIELLSGDTDKSFIKNGDVTTYILTKLDKLNVYKDKETIFLNKTRGAKQSFELKKKYVKSGNKIVSFKDTLTADWYIDNIKKASNNPKYRMPLDSAGVYKLKACTNYASGDTISIIDTIEVDVNIIDKPIVFFDKKNNYQGEFGFEKYEHPEFTDTLSLEKIKVNDLDYYVPWMSLKEKQTAEINATIFVPALYSGIEIKFESSDPSKIILGGMLEYDSTTLKQAYNKIKITVKAVGVTGFDSFCPIYVKNESGLIIGKLNVVSEKEEDYTGFNLTLVKVLTDSINTDIDLNFIEANLLTYFKNYTYKQAFVKWEEHKIEFDTLDLRGKIDSAYLNKVEIDYKKSKVLLDTLIHRYETENGDNLKERFFIFIVDKEGAYDPNLGAQLNGRGKLPEKGKNNYAIIYYNAKANYNDTYIHELGHNFGLQHPFSQFTNILQYSTKNIMDYGGDRNYFWRWQCKQIRNFKFND